MPTHDGAFLVRAYPTPGRPNRHVSQIGFYNRPGVNPDFDALDEAARTELAEMFARIIRDEDYVMSESQQTAADAGSLDHIVFGRNEPALHHYHGTYRSRLGLEPLPLLQSVGAEPA